MTQIITLNKIQELIDFENEIKDLFLAKKIRNPIHLSGTNELELIKIFEKIKPNDWVFSTHRNHYHALLKGIPKEEVKRQVLNQSMHINSRKHKFFTSAIVGGILPIALGVAMAIKRKKGKDKVYAFIGDMAAEMGVFQECLKYAEGYDLPITFIIEDNGLSVETNTRKSWGLKETKVVKYAYVRKFPHTGIGQWITF